MTAVMDLAGLDDGRVALSADQLEELDARLDGALVRPGDEEWGAAVLIWNGMVATTPALVVQPASVSDVAATVAFARDHRLLLSVKGGGHNIAGTALAERGLTLDMSRLRGVTVDPAAKVARVGAGCRLGDVDSATQEHGLATPLGFISETGVAGLTLGGGLGYLSRRFGWTVDNLLEVEVVTADGEVRTANREENAELFWALRGGGGNFGVVTGFTFRLHEVGPTVYGGLIAWPFERAGEILPAYRSLTDGAPREVTCFLIMLNAPPAPFVPAEWHGRPLCAMAVCYSGELAAAGEVLAPIRALGDPVVDLLREQPYTQLQSYLDATEPKGQHYYWKTEFAAELSDGLLATVRDLFDDCPIRDGQVGFLHLGGAVADRAADDGAVGNRDARFALGINGMWEPGDPDAAAYRQWIRQAWEKARPYSTGGNYINFQTDDDGDDRVRATYGANYDRLAAVKRIYDPHNLFRVNRNITPVG